VDTSPELAVSIGAQASFVDLFDAPTGETIFEKILSRLQVRRAFITRLPLAS
jgi:hypothetical protein